MRMFNRKSVKIIVLALALILVVGIGVYLATEPLYTPTAIPSSFSYLPRYTAHKALVSQSYQGNTIEAVNEALNDPVEGIEVDVRLSKDHVLFLYHGDTLEESTNGKGRPEDHTWNELQKLTYTSAKKEKITRLEEVLRQVGSKKFIFLDIKSAEMRNSALVKQLVDVIHRYYLQETVIVESFNPAFLVSMRVQARDILLMYDFTTNAKAMGEEVQGQFDKIPWILKQPFIQKQIRRVVRPDIVGPRWNLDRKILGALVKNDYPVISWTVDDPKVTADLFSLGVVGVQTNQSKELMNTNKNVANHVSDAGGTSAQVVKIIHVTSLEDIVGAISEGRQKHVPITIAGRRHSMGGQSLLNRSIQLDMLRFNEVTYHPTTQTVTAQAGATWRRIQEVLSPQGRSIQVMQSDNIFTVGGSISANVHGWQVGSPPLSSTVVSMKIVTADGEVRKLSSAAQPELFNAVIGGYGQLGVITEVELKTVPNSMLKFKTVVTTPKDFPSTFQKKVTQNSRAELAYGRLSVDRGNLLEEAKLCWYENTLASPSTSNVAQESLIAFKRTVFRFSQYTDWGKKLRWATEKFYDQRLIKQPATERNNVMNTDIHILWPLYGKNKDILHEYFVPKEKMPQFLKSLKRVVAEDEMNLLNVTVREVKADHSTTLSYAREDVFGFVLLFSQPPGATGEKKMRQSTKKIIDEVIKLGGTFYLPYRLHYSEEQLKRCYPNFNHWLEIKKKWDRKRIFDSNFLRYTAK